MTAQRICTYYYIFFIVIYNRVAQTKFMGTLLLQLLHGTNQSVEKSNTNVLKMDQWNQSRVFITFGTVLTLSLSLILDRTYYRTYHSPKCDVTCVRIKDVLNVLKKPAQALTYLHMTAAII